MIDDDMDTVAKPRGVGRVEPAREITIGVERTQ
jgi:hypothetical protein